MKLDVLRIFFLLVSFLTGTHAVYTAVSETKIRDEIFDIATYDPVSRPVSQTHVKVGLNILAIDSLDLKGQRLTIAGWITFEWEDPRLVWDKSLNADLEYIFTKPDYIWKPEVIVDNALDDFEIVQSHELLLRLHYDGFVDWEPPRLLTTHCEADITYYPYDEQKCSIQLVSWTYTIEEVDLQHLFENVNLEDFELHGEWDISHTRIEDKNLTEHLPDGSTRIYPELDFWLYLKRRTDFYNLNVMMPIILVSVMVVFVFIVPVESGEKLTYVLTVFLSLAVLLTIVADSLPRTSITISVLGLYLGIVLLLAAVGILLTILILLLFHKDGRPNKNSFMYALTHRAAKIICWKNHYLRSKKALDDLETKKALEENKVVPMKKLPNLPNDEKKNPVTTSNNGSKEKKIVDFVDDEHDDDEKEDGLTWKDVAMVLDRFCFFVFFMITLLMNLGFVITFSGLGRKTFDHSSSETSHH